MTCPPQINPTNPWQCQTCGREHPIKPLARDCEARHRAQERANEEDH